jgi:hypothetical protein
MNRPNPGSYPISSLESRAAARMMKAERERKAKPMVRVLSRYVDRDITLTAWGFRKGRDA